MALLKLWTLCLVLAVVFVNGWTDAPGAITGVVASGVLPYKRAVTLAAAMNLLGVVAMTALCPAVADTISGLVNFAAVDSAHSLAALAGAMTAIVLFAVGAWWFGIPTSESHALIAGNHGGGLCPQPRGGDPSGRSHAGACGPGSLPGAGLSPGLGGSTAVSPVGKASGRPVLCPGGGWLRRLDGLLPTAPRTGRSSLRCSSSPTGSPGGSPAAGWSWRATGRWWPHRLGHGRAPTPAEAALSARWGRKWSGWITNPPSTPIWRGRSACF